MLIQSVCGFVCVCTPALGKRCQFFYIFFSLIFTLCLEVNIVFSFFPQNFSANVDMYVLARVKISSELHFRVAFIFTFSVIVMSVVCANFTSVYVKKFSLAATKISSLINTKYWKLFCCHSLQFA